MSIRISQPTEHQIQAAVFKILRTFEERYWELKTIHAIPNGGKLPYGRTKGKGKGKVISPQRMKLVAEGMRSGIPDICVPYSNGINSGLYIEMKRPGEKTSPGQDKMISFLTDLNQKVVVMDSAKEAVSVIYNFTLCRYYWLAKKPVLFKMQERENWKGKAEYFKRDFEPVINNL